MRVIKDDNISFLAVTFGLQRRFHAAFTAMICFDLADPSLILPEKEMWETAKEQLPEGSVLDAGMPKARGEFLLAGSCCAYRGKAVTGQDVTVRVGATTKRISVFGNRYWIPQDGTMHISDPVPFLEMPLVAENAFGGDNHPTNRVGKGGGAISREGMTLRPLPNLEYPDILITSPNDTPPPATLLPLAVNHPQRAVYAGTYDDAWLKSRWPWYPDDIDARFFNSAPQDQWHEGYYSGSETIEVTGMHPDFPHLLTTLPRFRMRLFATRLDGVGDDEAALEKFLEIDNHIDTIWLFPTRRRGVILFRGIVDTKDDEMSDIKSVFAVAEPLDTTPVPAEEYREEQRRRTNRTVEIDKAPIAAAQERIATFLNSIPDIKRDLDTNMAVGFGKAPVATSTIADKFAAAGALATSFTPLIAQGEALAESFRAKYGHLIKIDTGFISTMKQKLEDVSASLGPMQEKAEAAVAGAEKGKQSAMDKLAALRKEHKAKGLPDIPEFGETPPKKLWQEIAFAFVQECVKNLKNDAVTLNRLTLLGLRTTAIRHAFLGINPEKRICLRKEWGLPEETPGKITFEIPAGFVIPRFDNATLAGIAIRPGDLLKTAGEHLVAGSDGKPLVMPGFRDDKLFARVGNDLDAILLQQEVWDFCSVVSIGRPNTVPDEESARLMKAAPLFFITLPADGNKKPKWVKSRMSKWRKVYPNAMQVVLPLGGSIIEAKRAGVNLRELFIRKIPVGLLEEMPEEHKEVKADAVTPGMKLPTVDAAALVKKYQGHAAAFAAPIKEKAEAQKAGVETMMRDALTKAGLDPDKTLAEAAAKRAAAPPVDPFDPKIVTTHLAQEKKRLGAAGLLTPEVAAKLDKASADFTTLLADSAKMHSAGMAKLADAQQQLAQVGNKPEWAKELYAQFGMDPESGACFTREQVIRKHKNGESLAGMKLDGIDLSKLDLTGINLEKAFCAKAIFAGSDLSGAKLNSGIFIEADFTKARLDRADVSGALFQKAALAGASLSKIEATRTLFQNADLAGADFSDARFNAALFEKSKLPNANFTGAGGQTAVFIGSDLTGADFSRGDMDKWVFQNCDMEGARFTNARAHKLTLLGCRSESLSLVGADLHKARFIQKSVLPGTDFTDANMESACIIASDLSRSDFRGANLANSFISESDMRGARLPRVSARGGRWEKSDFGDADMRGVDIMQGTLRKSRLTRANLSYANLYSVDFMRVKVGQTKFDNANLDRSMLENRVEFLDDDA